MSFSEDDLKEKFDAKNDKTNIIIKVFHYRKLSPDKKYYDEFTFGNGKMLTPFGDFKNQFIHLMTDETFTRLPKY
jgi:hypothetical protein